MNRERQGKTIWAGAAIRSAGSFLLFAGQRRPKPFATCRRHRRRRLPSRHPLRLRPKMKTSKSFSVSSNLVMVPVSVVDAQGQPVRGLQVSDFRLDEEGREQEIAEIGNPDQVPLDIAILFDVSSSVSQKGFFEFQQQAAASFLKQVMKPVDRARFSRLQMQPTLVAPLAPAETAAAKLLTIPAATTPVPTAFYDTVVAAAKYLSEKSAERHRRVILVISDGDDNSAAWSKIDVAEDRASQKGEVTTPAAADESLLNGDSRAVTEVQGSAAG